MNPEKSLIDFQVVTGLSGLLHRTIRMGIMSLMTIGALICIYEALQVVSPFTDVSKDDLAKLYQTNTIWLDEDQTIRWNHEDDHNYKGKFKSMIPLCDNGNLVQPKEGVLMWTFPYKFLAGFEDVFIATYMFEGQNMANYLKAHNVEYAHMGLEDSELKPFDEIDNICRKHEIAHRVSVIKDKMRNSVGNPTRPGEKPFSVNWCKRKKAGHPVIKQTVTNLEWFFKESLIPLAPLDQHLV